VEQGAFDGSIAFAPAGDYGFGYDPIFVPAGFDRTLSELGAEVKNRLSHRARALDLMKAWLLARRG
jgi:XTP/dITP diphosphohydrolase